MTSPLYRWVRGRSGTVERAHQVYSAGLDSALPVVSARCCWVVQIVELLDRSPLAPPLPNAPAVDAPVVEVCEDCQRQIEQDEERLRWSWR
ncbi:MULTISPECIES: hypothetical protein [unclassified Crossiella]|uniref:hypothetical protein n=1 Tax=unclassified Crossiella TaxID=2620835 RepID=UPI001FFE6B22|nr:MULTISPECIES: hypothetical protein [unclassified Crossiella]MCK2256035.1 hypothetical protein [Crossiella sp. S99.1]